MSNAPTGLADEGEDTRSDVRYLYDTIPISSGDGWYMLTVDCDEVTGKMSLYHDCGDEYDGFVTERRQIAWWMRYWRSVAETGDDPLNQTYKEWTVTVKSTWQAAFYQSAFSGVGVKARKNSRGKWIQGRLLPEYMQLYLCLKGSTAKEPPSNYAEKEDYSTIEEITSLAANSVELLYWSNRSPYTLPGANVWGLFKIPHQETRSRSTTEIKKIAKKDYKEEKTKYEQYISKQR